MKKFRSTHMQAAALMIDDRFKMGGKMYRITGVMKNDFDEWVIKFHPLKPSRWSPSTLIVPKNTRFKVYNQK